MRRFLAILAVIVTGCGASPERADAQPRPGPTWIGGSPADTHIVVGADGDTYVGIWIDAPPRPDVRRRAPMAISLAVDTSGSMSGQKIEYARQAAMSLIETLADGDIVSVYAFQTSVMEIAPPTVVGRDTRASLMQRVQGLTAVGGTNMYDGLTAAIGRVAQAPASHPLRRVMLISDGHATVGPSDAGSLGDLAARGSEHNLQVTAIGVGHDYDESTLGAVAVRSAGRLYHLGSPQQLASILEQEVQLLAHTVATNAYIEIVPAPGVIIIEGVTLGSRLEGNRLRVPLGNVFAEQRREVLFRAKVDTSRPGAHELATARFVFEEPERAGAVRTHTARVAYNVTGDRAQAARAASPRVQAMVATYQATETRMRAAEALDRGDGQAAAAQLSGAAQELQRRAAAAPRSSPVRARLEQDAAEVRAEAAAAAQVETRAAGRARSLEMREGAYRVQGY